MAESYRCKIEAVGLITTVAQNWLVAQLEDVPGF